MHHARKSTSVKPLLAGVALGRGLSSFACAVVLALAVAGAATTAWPVIDDLGLGYRSYERVESPDGAYVVILGSRSGWKRGYGAVWIASRAEADAGDWKRLCDWSRGGADAGWLADRVVEVRPAKWNAPYPPDSVVHWRDVEIRVSYGVP